MPPSLHFCLRAFGLKEQTPLHALHTHLSSLRNKLWEDSGLQREPDTRFFTFSGDDWWQWGQQTRKTLAPVSPTLPLNREATRERQAKPGYWCVLLSRPAEGRSWPQCEDFSYRWQLCLNWSWFPWQPISIIWAFHSKDFKGQIILEITWFSIPEQSPRILAVWVSRLPLYERILKTRSHRTISISKSMHIKSSGISPQSTSAWDGLLEWLLCWWCFFVKVLQKSKNFFFCL